MRCAFLPGPTTFAVLVAVLGVALHGAVAHAGCALSNAVMANNIKEAKTLVRDGANVSCKTSYGVPVLSVAAEKGFGKIVELLLENGADVNGRDRHRETPLYLAKNARIAEILLAHGAKVNAKTDQGLTPLQRVARRGFGAQDNQAMVKLAAVLVAHGANVNEASPLCAAAMYNKIAMAKFLLAHGADPNRHGILGCAVGNGDYLKMAQLLVAHGAKVNVEAPGGWYPLDSAVFTGNTKCVRFLLSKGANPNLKTKKGYTALYIGAAYDHNASAIAALLRHGADPNEKSINGWTPLDQAATYGALKVGEALLAYGANVNAVGDRGRTALYLLVGLPGRFGLQFIELLVKHGADVDAAPPGNPRPLTLAMARHETKIALYLRRHGAHVGWTAR